MVVFRHELARITFLLCDDILKWVSLLSFFGLWNLWILKDILLGDEGAQTDLR